jgi:hypothetical protein
VLGIGGHPMAFGATIKADYLEQFTGLSTDNLGKAR